MRAVRFHIILLLMVIGLVSCRPKGVLSTRDMVDLLVDIHLVDAMTDVNYGPVPSEWKGHLTTEQFRDLAYLDVLYKHGVTEAQFYASVAYYSKNLRLYTRIYSDVDQRYRRLIDDIEHGAYHRAAPVDSAEWKRDSLRIRTLYERRMLRPDTLSRLRASYAPDSVTSWHVHERHRWLMEKRVSVPFLMVDTLTVLPANAAALDSTQTTTVTDTLDHETWAMKLLHGEVEQPGTAPAARPLDRRDESVYGAQSRLSDPQPSTR